MTPKLQAEKKRLSKQSEFFQINFCFLNFQVDFTSFFSNHVGSYSQQILRLLRNCFLFQQYVFYYTNSPRTCNKNVSDGSSILEAEIAQKNLLNSFFLIVLQLSFKSLSIPQPQILSFLSPYFTTSTKLDCTRKCAFAISEFYSFFLYTKGNKEKKDWVNVGK